MLGPLSKEDIFSLFLSSDLVQLCLDYLSAYPLLVMTCLCVPVMLLVGFLYLISSEDTEPRVRKSKKKKKEEQREKKESKKEK